MSESPIFDGILSTSRQKADKMVEKAEAEAKELLAEAQHNAAKAVEEERRQAFVRLEAVRVKEESAERSFQRLEELKRSDEAYQAVDAALGEAFERYFKGPDARKTLIAWTAEAALGLGLPEAKVASCLATRMATGTPIDLDILWKAHEAEEALRAIGYSDHRVRTDGRTATVVLRRDQMPTDGSERKRITDMVSGFMGETAIDDRTR